LLLSRCKLNNVHREREQKAGQIAQVTALAMAQIVAAGEAIAH
jgi:hypothetical protein